MKINGNRKMPHGNLPIYEKTCYGSGMKTDYEKAIEWLNKKAEKAGGITNLGKTVGAPASTFFRVLKGGSPPGADKLLDWISQLGGKIVFPDERMEGYTLIPKVVAQAGAGSSLITSDEVLGMYAFRDDFLRRVGVHAKESVMLDVIGHSMEPMIRHKDTILVDQSVKELPGRGHLPRGLRGGAARQARPAHPARLAAQVGKPRFLRHRGRRPGSRNLPCLREGTLVRAGRLRAAPSSGKAPATRLSRLTGGVPPLPFAAPANLHISRNAARARLLGGTTGRLPAQPSAGTPSFFPPSLG